MKYQICYYCGKNTPLNNFCIYCGNRSLKTKICQHCNNLISEDVNYCPFCGKITLYNQIGLHTHEKTSLNPYLKQFRSAILVIFLLAVYQLIQILVGSVLIFFFEDNLGINNFALYNILVMLVSTVIMIYFSLKMQLLPSFLLKNEMMIKKYKPSFFTIFLTLILTISSVEVLLTFLNSVLDIFSLSPVQASPYDDFFLDTINIVFFSILAIFIGPILEELIFRRLIIAALLPKFQSNAIVIVSSALIFGLSHTAADLLAGSFRYTILHLAATITIGIILGIVFLKWGLKYSIILHAAWNFFSLIGQVLAIYSSLEVLDIIIVLSIVFSIIIIVVKFFNNRASLKYYFPKIKKPAKHESSFIILNLSFIILYELLLPSLLVIIGPTLVLVIIIFLSQIIGAIIGFLIIDKEKKEVMVF